MNKITLSIATRPLSVGMVATWVAKATAGDVLVYHQGFLGRDRWVLKRQKPHGDGTSEFSWVEPVRPTHDLAMEMWTFHLLGLVTLTQRRLGPGLFEYRATRTMLRRVTDRTMPATVGVRFGLHRVTEETGNVE